MGVLTFLSLGPLLADEPGRGKEPTEIHQFQLQSSVWSVAFSPDGKWVLVDNELREATGGKRIRSLGSTGARRAAFSLDGQFVATGNGPAIRLWEVATGKEVWKAVHPGAGCLPENTFACVAFTPDGKHLLSGGGDGTIRLWRVATGKEVRCFQWEKPQGRADAQAFAVAVSPDGKYALVGGRAGLRPALWELETGKELRRFDMTGLTVALACSPDCRYIFQSAANAGLFLWDVETGKCIRRVQEGHSYGVAFSPDGRYVAAGIRKGDVHCWEVATGMSILMISAHNDWINSLAFSPDGKCLLSGSSDETARLWRLNK